MAKFAVLVAIVLCAALGAEVAGYNGRYRNWDQFQGQVGFGRGLFPEAQSGTCGKQAGDSDTGDDEDNGAGSDDDDQVAGGGEGDDEDNGTGSDDDYHVGGGGGDDEGGSDDGGNSNGGDDYNFDDGNNHIGGGGGGDGGGFDFGDGFDFDGIFGGLGFGNGGSPWSNGFSSKTVAENASDAAPDKFITAGKPAGIREYPWLVHLQIKVVEGGRNAMIGCGGSLISPRFVLTAAHCVKVNYRSYNDISIVLSEYDTRKSPRDCVGRTCVKNVVMHPDKVIAHSQFEPNQLANDVALMRLRGSAPYTDFIRPICLPSFNIDDPQNKGTTLAISGWGLVGDNRQASPIKLKAQVKLVPHQDCRRHYSDLTRSHVCAASRNGQDTCQGDSGGPLMVQKGGSYYVVGIVSGKSSATTCGSSMPTLYTNVYSFSKWIKQHMGRN